MVYITPELLKRLRKHQRLTLDQLAEKAGLDRQTIYRLERGRRAQTRETTFKKLAKALGVEPEDLSGPVPDDQESVSASEPNKSQLNLRVSGQTRNALLLVSERYRVKPAQIVELAPLLFNLVAEKCLQQRQELLHSLRERQSKIEQELERFVSDVSDIVEGPPPEIELELDELWNDEDCAIYFGYLFREYGHADPIADHLAELTSELGDQAEFGGWRPDSSPTYSVCKEEATWLANGDEVSLENILQGYAPLHELPKEFWEQLRNRNTFSLTDTEEINAIRQRQASERVEWLRAHGKRISDNSSEIAS